ncbi:MAG: winged helix-turn-helix transcriptional regulator [Candidatus Woesearchaeota archaeon]
MEKRDKRLLYELEMNSRRSISSIGKISRMSQQTADYKIKLLLKKDIIKNFVTIINYSTTDYLCFRVFFQLRQKMSDKYNSFIKMLKDHKNTLEISMVRSRYDLIVAFAYNNPLFFNTEFKKIVQENIELIKDYDIMTSVSQNYFGRKYLSPKSEIKNIFIGGEAKLIHLEPVDKRILFILSRNSRIPIAEICSDVNKSPSTVINKIKMMKKLGIILSYSCFINPISVDHHQYIILLRSKNLTLKLENNLANFCIQNPNIISFVKTFGNWDYELTVETITPTEFRKIYENIRQRFEDIMDDFNILIVNDLIKSVFLPESFSQM